MPSTLVGHFMAYLEATDDFFGLWSDEDVPPARDAQVAALERLRVAHNEALDWIKAESARQYGAHVHDAQAHTDEDGHWADCTCGWTTPLRRYFDPQTVSDEVQKHVAVHAHSG